MDPTRKSYLYAGLSVLFWSTIPTVFKIGLGELNVLSMLAIATFTSTIALLIILISGGKWSLLLNTSPREYLTSAMLGLINPFIYYIILLKAYKLLPGQVAQPLNMIWPIILVFLSVPFLKQKIPGKSFLALFISFAGVYIISSQGHPFKPGSSDPVGVILATGSSFFWALYFIFNIRDKREGSVKLFTNFLFASVYLIIALAITGNSISGVSFKGLAASVYVGLFEMGVTFLFWLKALQLAETSDKVSNLVYLAPFISLLFLYFIIKEPVYFTTPIGLILIISGIYIQNSRTKPVIIC
ncbi:MAG: DMT family transporter [Bacteroidales bacterium]|jgi:drug/metabolite transporter (DMT)-like permease